LTVTLALSAFQEQWDAYLESRVESAGFTPSGKSKRAKAEHEALCRDLKASITETEGKPLADQLVAQREHVKTLLKEAAKEAHVPPSDEWTVYDRVSSRTYDSMDMGTGRYAQGSADTKKIILEENGFEAKVEVESRETPGVINGKTYTYREAVVYVKVAPEDVQILKHKDLTMDLVVWVAKCWARGDNPRCFDPFLPHGFEEAHGIRFDGTIIPPDPVTLSLEVIEPVDKPSYWKIHARKIDVVGVEHFSGVRNARLTQDAFNLVLELGKDVELGHLYARPCVVYEGREYGLNVTQWDILRGY
jgi:hypothetical protein